MDVKTFKEQVIPVKNKLYRFAWSIVKETELAEDIVQEVLIRMWDRRDKMDAVQNIEAWCMRSTRNLALDKLKSKHQRFTDTIPEGFDVESDSQTPERDMENKDTMQSIQRLIDMLPQKQQQVIRLRDVEGYSYKEISDMMEIDMNQVKVNLFRARKSVKENLVNINAYGL